MIDYEKMYRAVYKRGGLVSVLRTVDRVAVIFTVVAYAALVTLSFTSDIIKGVVCVAVSAVPFILLSIFRRVLSAPRPYELYDFPSLGIDLPRKKSGSSFPSRHIFSSFLIGTLFLTSVPLLGAIVLLLGVGLGACRVLRGIHFIRDCIAGAVIGVVCGIIGLIILSL